MAHKSNPQKCKHFLRIRVITGFFCATMKSWNLTKLTSVNFQFSLHQAVSKLLPPQASPFSTLLTPSYWITISSQFLFLVSEKFLFRTFTFTVFPSADLISGNLLISNLKHGLLPLDHGLTQNSHSFGKFQNWSLPQPSVWNSRLLASICGNTGSSTFSSQ